jgi:hypothetical protein
MQAEKLQNGFGGKLLCVSAHDVKGRAPTRMNSLPQSGSASPVPGRRRATSLKHAGDSTAVILKSSFPTDACTIAALLTYACSFPTRKTAAQVKKSILG